MKLRHALIFALAVTACTSRPKDGVYTFQVLTTNDTHGTWFDSTYTGGGIKKSLYGIMAKGDSVRQAVGKENVILVDAGDCLQGDNAVYYYDYVDTVSPHLYPRLAEYMGYEAVAVGNHDIEAGHHVYDRVAKQLEAKGIPFMAANAVRTDNGKPYFTPYKIIKRNGLKIAILGYTNANMKEWLSEDIWSGMDFKNLIPQVQEDVDRITAKEKPQMVIVLVHSGTGKGDGSILESQGLDLYESLHGVDFLVCSHDHSARIVEGDEICLIDSGSHSRNVGHGEITITIKDGKVVDKKLRAELIPVVASQVDTAMRNYFRKDFETVKAFSTREIGELQVDLVSKDSYKGMCDYVNLIHAVCLGCSPAEISFAAPLSYNKTIKAGTLVYNDLINIYPYENLLYIVKMTGEEVKNFLEYSYDGWIEQNDLKGNGHVLRIQKKNDLRNSQDGWSFVKRSYNFDSAGGLVYTVDVTKPKGERVNIISMADGSAFDMAKEYNVAMTSYRANGGGSTLPEGAGIKNVNERIVKRYPEIRNIIYDYIKEKGTLDPAVFSDPALIGHWSFIPSPQAQNAIEADWKLLFGK